MEISNTFIVDKNFNQLKSLHLRYFGLAVREKKFFS